MGVGVEVGGGVEMILHWFRSHAVRHVSFQAIGYSLQYPFGPKSSHTTHFLGAGVGVAGGVGVGVGTILHWLRSQVVGQAWSQRTLYSLQ